MSDYWDFYFTTLDDQTASVFVDLGASAEAPVQAYPNMVCLHLALNSPTEEGLSSSEESAPLAEIEDALITELTDNQLGAYVGRITSGGTRDFFFYVASPDTWRARIETLMSKFPLYPTDSDTWEDPNWETYFNTLYPSPEEMQTIKNNKVCEQLESMGDTLEQPREIDHWIYFTDPAQREAFQAQIIELGFGVRNLLPPTEEEPREGIQIFREDLPAYGAIDDVTVPLLLLAQEYGGEYDGWETELIAPDEPAASSVN